MVANFETNFLMNNFSEVLLVRLLKLSVSSTGLLILVFTFILPRSLSYILYSTYRLVFGTLYPAYASYKAVRTASVKEYVRHFFSLSTLNSHNICK